MKIARYLAGTLMIISGVWHGILAFQAVENRPMLAFAIVYLIIGILLLIKNHWGVYLSAIIFPLVGLLTASIKIGWRNFDFSLYSLVVIGITAILISSMLLLSSFRKVRTI